MKILKNEKVKASHGSLILTNKRIIQRKESWGKEYTKEIPLNKIDSISYIYARNHTLLLFGCLIMFCGIAFVIFSSGSSNEILDILGILGFLMIPVGAALVILAALLPKEVIEIKSVTLEIREEGKGMDKFINALRNEIYKNKI